MIFSTKNFISNKKTFSFFLIIFLFCANLFSTEYIYTGNWSPSAPNWNTLTTSDIVTIKTTASITLSSDVTIGTLNIDANTNPVNFDLGGNLLTVGTLSLGTGDGGLDGKAGNLKLSNGTASIDVFDESDKDDNYFELSNVECTVTTTIYANGSGITTIIGDGSSKFIIPPTYDTSWGQNSILDLTGITVVSQNSFGYKYSTDVSPCNGITVTVKIENTSPFTDIKYSATITNTNATNSESYSVNGNTITSDASNTMTFSSNTIQQFAIVFPTLIDKSDGIRIVFSDSSNNPIGTLFYTQLTDLTNTTTWKGTVNSAWENTANWTNGVPSSLINIVKIPLTANQPVISSDTNSLSSVTLQENAELTIKAKLSSTTIINKGKIIVESGADISSSTITNTTNSTVTYNNFSSLLLGNNYYNLEINCALSTSNEINVLGKVTIDASSNNVELSNSSNTFSDGIEIISGGNIKINASSSFVLEPNTNCSSLEISSPVSISGTITTGSTTFKNNISLTASTVLNGNVNFEGTTSISGNMPLKIEGNTTISSSNSLSISDNSDFQLTGNFTNNGTVNLKNLSFVDSSSPAAITFTPGTTGSSTYETITINTNAPTFTIDTNALTATNLSITKGTNTQFNQPVTIDTFQDTTNAGDICFADNSTITNITSNIFNTTGTITFGQASTTVHTISESSGFTHTAGPTVANGTIKSKSITVDSLNPASSTPETIDLILETTSLQAGNLGTSSNKFNSITLGKSGQPFSFTGTTTDINTKKLAIIGTTISLDKIKADYIDFDSVTANITLANTIETTDTSKDIIFPTQVYLSENTEIKSAKGIIFNSKIDSSSSTKKSLILTAVNSTLESNIGSINSLSTFKADTNLQISGCTEIISDNIVFPNASKTINLSNSLEISGYTLLNTKITQSGSGNKLTITGDTVINEASLSSIDITIPVECENFVLFNGKLNINANLTTNKDFVLFGNGYNDTDQVSSVAQAYKYNGNYTKTILPDGAALPASFNGDFSTTGTPVITVKKNFYANGITASNITADEWTLALSENYNKSNISNEAYNCDFSSSKCIVSCNSSTSTPNPVAIAAENCSSIPSPYDSGWDTDDFKISEAYTVHDNLIYIKFNREICTSDNLTNNIERIQYEASGSQDGKFKDIFTSSDLSSISTLQTTTAPLTEIYICATTAELAPSNGYWNTDATGTSSGEQSSDTNRGSTDTHGKTHNTIPSLDIPRNSSTYSYFIRDVYGKRLLNYTGASKYTIIEDKCAPVVTWVKTGQELHTIYDSAFGENSQHSYDSHNYIEFEYSEPVDFGTEIPSTIPNENIQVNTTLGILEGDISQEGQLIFSGLGSISNGKIHTGKNGTTDATVNAIYYDNPYSIRISIAGLTDGTVTDNNGNTFKKWVGYIEDAVTPSGTYDLGTITPIVKDLATNPNLQKNNKIGSTNYTQYDYQPWDVSPPVFARCRLDSTSNNYDTEYYEAVGTGTGSTLNRIEIHLFDNKIEYSNNKSAYWLTQRGWCTSQSTNLKITDAYCSDIFGGSRPFDTDSSTRTTGGIRLSTKINSENAFKYTTIKNGTPTQSFNSVYQTIASSFFTGASTQRRSNDDPDGLYLGLELSDTTLSLNSTFTIKYDSSINYITDLAGNRLRTETINTIDRTPPSINLVLSALNKDEIDLIFVKNLQTNSQNIKYIENGTGTPITISESYEQIIPYCFEVITIDASGNPQTSTDLQISQSVPAQIKHISNNNNGKNNEFTILKLKLNRTVTLNDLQTYYVQLKHPNQYNTNITSRDPISTLDNCYVTFIQDTIGNYTPYFTAHSISDFAINVINPLYAYASDIKEGDNFIMNNLYEENSWAVHDWNAEQQNYGTIPANREITIISSFDDGTSTQSSLPSNVRMYYSNNPDSNSVSTQYNQDFNTKLRIWFPSLSNGLFDGISHINNTNYNYLDSTTVNSQNNTIQFQFSKKITENWNSKNQISFLFGILDSSNNQIRIYNAPSYNISINKYELSPSTKVPLYCLRLTDPNDFTSLDLWSFKVESITEQRGSTTILNNVINPEKGEKTVIKINTTSPGPLNVMIMTLDGNIIQYIAHGQTSSGEHYYTWNGKNKAGTTVARGMYFVRIVGNGIDETRKIMVVK